MLSASIGGLVIAIQMGSPAIAEIQPDDVDFNSLLIDDLLLLDCRLLEGDLKSMHEFLEQNTDLLRLIEEMLPECLIEADGAGQVG